jgi:hypothetical protein
MRGGPDGQGDSPDTGKCQNRRRAEFGEPSQRWGSGLAFESPNLQEPDQTKFPNKIKRHGLCFLGFFVPVSTHQKASKIKGLGAGYGTTQVCGNNVATLGMTHPDVCKTVPTLPVTICDHTLP